MARILIAGCGDIGTRLGLRLSAADHEVWGLKRNPTTLPDAIRPVAADLTDSASLAVIPAELDYLVYIAAADGFNEASYNAAYVEGPRRLLALLEAAEQPLRRVLFVSSTSVYGDHDGDWIDEQTPASATSFAGTCLRAGESVFQDASYPAIVVRFGGIYGPGRTRLIDSVRSGRARCTQGVYSNRIHSEDCAALLQHLLELVAPESLYLGVDDEPALLCEVMTWLAQQLNAPLPLIQAADTAEAMQRGNKRCRNNRLKDSGFQFRYPSYREGYTALLATQNT